MSSIEIEVDGSTIVVASAAATPETEITATVTDVVEVSTPGAQGPPGPGGGSSTFSGEASETIAALRAVRTLVDGRFALWSPVAQPDEVPSGVSQTAGSSGDDIEVVPGGVLNVVGAGFTPGARYWVKAGGVLTAVLSEVVGLAVVVEVGIALDAENLSVRIHPGIRNP